MAGSLWFPQPPRDFNGQRWLRVSLRTVHLIRMAFLVGGAALLLVGAAIAPRSALAMVVLAIIIGGISSHMPG